MAHHLCVFRLVSVIMVSWMSQVCVCAVTEQTCYRGNGDFSCFVMMVNGNTGLWLIRACVSAALLCKPLEAFMCGVLYIGHRRLAHTCTHTCACTHTALGAQPVNIALTRLQQLWHCEEKEVLRWRDGKWQDQTHKHTPMYTATVHHLQKIRTHVIPISPSRYNHSQDIWMSNTYNVLCVCNL